MIVFVIFILWFASYVLFDDPRTVIPTRRIKIIIINTTTINNIKPTTMVTNINVMSLLSSDCKTCVGEVVRLLLETDKEKV